MERINVKKILENLKENLHIKTDMELSRIFDVKPNTISTWKKRNSLDYERLISICRTNGISLNELFYGDSAGESCTNAYRYKYVFKTS